MSSQRQHLWWQTSILYQIYPRSFQDSNGDGIGDLQGIKSRLDYLQWLGIETIWLSPIFNSPMADFGYDVADYTGIDPIFGNMADFDELLVEVHRRKMKLVLDLVPNHTSDQHPWFLESRSSTTNPKRDWYIWKDAKPDGSLPNNWLSVFGGSAWEWDGKTQQYYYHGFLKEQPDLNWRNPEVQQAMLDVMRFWLDKGVDGFRVDVLWHLIKDEQLRDNPINVAYEDHLPTYDQLLPIYSTDQDEVHELVAQMRNLLDQYEERMMVGEIYLPIDRLMRYYGLNNDGAHLPFNFQLLMLPWKPQEIANAISAYEQAIPNDGWPNWVLSNHDRPRLVSRVGIEQARVAALLLLTLRGTPTIYYGDEMAMRDVPIPRAEIQDPQGFRMPDKNLSRDPCRTPMPWDGSQNAGFSNGKSWLRLDDDWPNHNIESQQADPNSVLLLYKRLIAFRQQEPSLKIGKYSFVHADRQLLVYTRQAADSAQFLIVLNLSHAPAYFKPKEFKFKGTIVIATSIVLEGKQVADELNLYGNEALVIKLD